MLFLFVGLLIISYLLLKLLSPPLHIMTVSFCTDQLIAESVSLGDKFTPRILATKVRLPDCLNLSIQLLGFLLKTLDLFLIR